MGYSHYWRWNPKKKPSPVALSNAIKEMALIIEDSKDLLAGFDGQGKPDVSSTEVRFNGKAEKAHETFRFPGDMRGFNFTKTAYKPYDKVVTACLLVARANIPEEVLEVSSDGDWSNWQEGRDLYEKVLGKEPVAPRKLLPDASSTPMMAPDGDWVKVIGSPEFDWVEPIKAYGVTGEGRCENCGKVGHVIHDLCDYCWSRCRTCNGPLTSAESLARGYCENCRAKWPKKHSAPRTSNVGVNRSICPNCTLPNKFGAMLCKNCGSFLPLNDWLETGQKEQSYEPLPKERTKVSAGLVVGGLLVGVPIIYAIIRAVKQ